MKIVSCFILIGLTICSHVVHGQNISATTNEMIIDLTKPVSATLPTIQWVFPEMEYTNSEDQKITIKADVAANDQLSELIINVYHDDELLGAMNLPIETGASNFKVNRQITLVDGQNRIEIIAKNKDGGTSASNRFVITGMDAVAKAVAIDRKDYALLIATDKYDNWNDLVNPIEDAHAIADVLKNKYGFHVEVAENLTREDIFIKLREYSEKKYKPQDQLFIFFAGHGQFDETFGEGYVVARNSLLNDKGKSSYIPHSTLRQYINNIPSEHIFLTMDVCFGGTFDPVLASSRAAYEEADDNEYLVRKLSLRTRKYLTSGGKEYVSDGVPGQHSPFARKLIEALKEGAGEDGILITLEINSYMERLKTRPRFGEFGDDEKGSDFVFVLK